MVHLLLKKNVNTVYALAALIIMLTTGCSTLQSIPSMVMPKKEAPARVYIQPLRNYYRNAAVLVFEFQAPEHVPDSGYFAADILYQTLLSSRTFGQVNFIPGSSAFTLEDQLNMARLRKADLIIIGSIQYFFEAESYLNSRVDQEIKIINSHSAATYWHAQASSSGKARPATDYVLMTRKELKGPTPKELRLETRLNSWI